MVNRQNFSWRMVERPMVPIARTMVAPIRATLSFKMWCRSQSRSTGYNDAPVLHELREVGCFAARSRTGIEDFFSRIGIEKPTGNCCAGILNVAMTTPERCCGQSVELYEIRMARLMGRN